MYFRFMFKKYPGSHKKEIVREEEVGMINCYVDIDE